MITPGKLPLAGGRWTPFAASLTFTGIDLTDAVMEAHVRLKPDQSGTPLADMDTVTVAGDEGLRLVSVALVDSVSVSLVDMRMDEATMEAMPTATELGDDAEFHWDLQITPSGGIKQVYLYGTFTVRAGVTH